MKIRPASDGDYQRLEYLSFLNTKEPKWQNPIHDTVDKVFRPLHEKDEWLLLVAEEEGEVVAYVTSDEFNSSEKTLVAETIFVHPDHRRKGIGEKLMNEYVRKWVNERGYKLHVYAVGIDSYHFFNKLGFKFRWARMDCTPQIKR